MSCSTCHKLEIPNVDVLTAQNLPEDTRETFLHRQCPPRSYCYCGSPLSHGSILPPALTIALTSGQPQTPGASQSPTTTPTSPTTAVTCPSLPTIRDEVTVPALDAQFTLMTDCPGSFILGGNVILPGRGVFRIDDVDLELQALTVRNVNVQPGLTILAKTKVWSLPGLSDMFSALLADTYGAERTDNLSGQGLLFLTEAGLKLVAPKENHYLAGGPGGDGEFPYWKMRPLSELLDLIAPGINQGNIRISRDVPIGSFTTAGSEIINAPDIPENIDISAIWLGLTLQNAATDAERNFVIGSRTYEVRRTSYLRIHEAFPYTSSTIPVTIPTNGSITSIVCTGYEGQLVS